MQLSRGFYIPNKDIFSEFFKITSIFQEILTVRIHSILFSKILLLTILASQAFSQSGSLFKTTPNGSKETADRKSTVSTVTAEKIEQDVTEAVTVIQNNYAGGKKLDNSKMFKSSIDSMLHTLDPHSNYFDAKETEQFRNTQRSQYFGIGASIGALSDKDGKVIATYIRATFEGAPANRAGLRFGD